MESTMLKNIDTVKNKGIKLETILKDRLILLEKYKTYNSVVAYNETELLSQAMKIDGKIQAGKSVGKLCGAIITIKDNLDVKGLPSTGGIEKFKNSIASEDCSVVKNLKSEDAIILGKTNMPAAAMDMQTFNAIYGRTNHPDFPEYTCGGSSGGGATSIKLGISDADIGNDFMGSIRVPAHFCGIYGMIGTDKVIPLENIVGGKPYGSTMSNILRIGIQAKTLEDIDFLFNVLANKSMLFPSTYSNNPIKIIYTENSSGLPLSEDYRYVYTEYINKLKRNFQVKKINQDEFDFSKARDCFLKLIYGNMSISLPPIIRFLLKWKMSSKLRDFLLSEEVREKCIMQLDSLFDNYDILISPVTVTPAFKHKLPIKTRGYQVIYDDMLVDGKKVSYATANMGYTTPFSLTSSPVIVIPIGKSKEGLPIGVQIVGRRFHDLDLKKIVTVLDQNI
ncbi:amidase [Clostridium hydrogenum]|uniref:amidase n=1 Tax=Clostridium hydrogenum TaxID=2855764 RepID=UPI001F245CB6|nr:amidase [Clostridium hydrogenum]